MGRKPTNLVGRRFGRLTVIKEAGRNEHGQVQWLCRCDCGNETIVLANNLRSGGTKSCGCGQHQSNAEDLTGQRFGRLTVLRRDGRKRNFAAWLCQCDCGNTVTVSSKHLKTGAVKSCGCYHREIFPTITYKNCYKNTKISNLQHDTIERSGRNVTGYRGITYRQKEDVYDVVINISGHRTYIGRFHNLEDAVKARARAVEQYNLPIIEEYEMEKQDRRKYNSGTVGNRGGTGRPPVDNPRKPRTLRATDDEYNLLRRFKNCMKKNMTLCDSELKKIEDKIKNWHD